MAARRSAPYMTLAAANFFLKYAKARGVSKVARGEAKSSATSMGFMQAFAKAKGDPKKLTKMQATANQTWAERRDNFVRRHMAQVTLHGEKLWETAGRYKGQPTRRHLGLIMWAMTPDPNGVGRFIAKERGVKVPPARTNGLSKRRTSGSASKGQGIRVPKEWVENVEDAVVELTQGLQPGRIDSLQTFVRLPLNAEGMSERVRALLKYAALTPPHGVTVIVHAGEIPSSPDASGIYSPANDRIEFVHSVSENIIRHELIHMIQFRASTGLRVAKPGSRISQRAAKRSAAGVGQIFGADAVVGTRRAFWTVEAEISGQAGIGEKNGKVGVVVLRRRPGRTPVQGVDVKFYPFPVYPMPEGTVAVTHGQLVEKGDVLFTQPGSPKVQDRPTPVEFEAYLGPLIGMVERAVDNVYWTMLSGTEAVPPRERVRRGNAEVAQFVKDVAVGHFRGDKRAGRDAAKRLADAGARRIAFYEEGEAAQVETIADRLRRARLFAADPSLRAAWEDEQARANPRYTTAKRDDPDLWEAVKAKVTAGSRGGKPGQWSARKAQMAVAEYQKRGGGYVGPKSPRNALAKWTREEWGTKSGKASLKTGERYLPKAAREALTPAEYAATTRAKRAGLRSGEQFTPQPGRIARKTAKYRK